MVTQVLQNIRFRLLAPFVGGMVVLLVVSLWSLNFYRALEREELEERIETQLSNNFKQEISSNINSLSGFLNFIGENQTLQKQWQERSLSQLQDLSYPIFNELRYKHNVTHFYYHERSGVNFLRVHSPNRFGDSIKRATLAQAIRTGDQAAGLEFGAFGEFVLRVVIPWKINGEIVGYLELGKEIDQIIDRLSTNNDYPLILAIHNNFIYENNLQQTDYFKKHATQLQQVSNVYVIDTTFSHYSERFERVLDSSNFKESRSYSDEGRDYLLSNISINNFQEQEIATLFYLVDRSLHVLHQKELIQQISIVAIGVSILLYVL